MYTKIIYRYVYICYVYDMFDCELIVGEIMIVNPHIA